MGEPAKHTIGDAHRLAVQAAAAAAWQHGHRMPAGDLHRGDHLIRVAGEGHPHRHHLVDAGIGAVEQAGHAVEADLAQLPPDLLHELPAGFRCGWGNHG